MIKLVALFEPFILHNDHVFEAANIEQLSAALARRGTRRFRLRCPFDRLVGLLDQRPHSGAAQVVLSSDRGTPSGSSSATQRAARGCMPRQASREPLASLPRRRPDPNTVAIFLTGSTGYIGAHIASNLLAGHSDPLNLLVRARDEQEARGRLWRSLQLHLDFPRFRRISQLAHPYFSGRSHRFALRLERGRLPTALFARPIR